MIGLCEVDRGLPIVLNPLSFNSRSTVKSSNAIFAGLVRRILQVMAHRNPYFASEAVQHLTSLNRGTASFQPSWAPETGRKGAALLRSLEVPIWEGPRSGRFA